MSKSLGNFVTVHELLVLLAGLCLAGRALRFNMFRTHYRQPLDWTHVSLDEAHKTLWDWYGDVEGHEPAPEVPDAIVEALSDDLNTPKVIAELHKLHGAKQFSELRAALGFLGFSGKRSNIKRNAVLQPDRVENQSKVYAPTITVSPSSEQVDDLIAARHEARKAKDFAEADRIRDELLAMGIVLKDAKDPATGELKTTWEVAR